MFKNVGFDKTIAKNNDFMTWFKLCHKARKVSRPILQKFWHGFHFKPVISGYVCFFWVCVFACGFRFVLFLVPLFFFASE